MYGVMEPDLVFGDSAAMAVNKNNVLKELPFATSAAGTVTGIATVAQKNSTKQQRKNVFHVSLYERTWPQLDWLLNTEAFFAALEAVAERPHPPHPGTIKPMREPPPQHDQANAGAASPINARLPPQHDQANAGAAGVRARLRCVTAGGFPRYSCSGNCFTRIPCVLDATTDVLGLCGKTVWAVNKRNVLKALPFATSAAGTVTETGRRKHPYQIRAAQRNNASHNSVVSIPQHFTRIPSRKTAN